MKLLIYSDLHLEFKNPFKPPLDLDADVLILAGDIIVFKDFEPLRAFLADWKKPVIYITGNHEYYTNTSMEKGDKEFAEFIKDIPNLIWLRDSSVVIDDVHFFGGTMWTHFNNSEPLSMFAAGSGMNDYRYIRNSNYSRIQPQDTVKFHSIYKQNLLEFLEKTKDKKRVIISHHSPVTNPKSNYRTSRYIDAYNSLDMVKIIEQYEPNLWLYGHTHESDDQMVGKTRVVSNPFGYHKQQENPEFDPKGLLIEV